MGIRLVERAEKAFQKVVGVVAGSVEGDDVGHHVQRICEVKYHTIGDSLGVMT